MEKIRRLPVKDIDAALRAYYGTGYISNKEIGAIFGVTTPSTIYNLKKPVVEAEKALDIPIVVPFHVNTKIAFEAWNIDVAELERNRKKMMQLGLDQDVKGA